MGISYREPGKAYRSSIKYDGSGGAVTFSACAKIGQALLSYEEPGLTYNDPLYTYNGETANTIARFTARARIAALHSASFTARGRILAGNLQTVTARARMLTVETETFTAKARLSIGQKFQAKSRIMPTLYMRARISRQQGWPVPETDDDGLLIFQDTRIYSKAKVSQYVGYPTYLLNMKGRVWYGKTQGLETKARIVNGPTMSIKAQILPRFFYSRLHCSFDIEQVAQTRMRVVFYTEGQYTRQTLGMRSYIQKMMSTRMTGHFIVAMTPQVQGVMQVSNPTSSVKAVQTLGMRVFVVR